MPIFLLIALGYFLKRIKLFNDEFLRVANDFTFKVLLSVLLFFNVFTADLKNAFNLPLILFSVLGVILIYTILMLTVPHIVKDKKKASVMIQGIFRSNFILFGVPLSKSIFGPQGAATAAVVAAFYVPTINILSTLVLFKYSDAENKNLANVLKGVITNPLVLGGFIGILVSVVKLVIPFDFPVYVNQTLNDITLTASPIAFIILGADLKFKSLIGNIKYVFWGIAGKLIIIPILGLTVAYLAGYRGLEFAILIAIFSTPNAVSSYAMAIKFKADSKLAGELIVSSTIFSIVTMFLVIFISKALQLI
jgi:predicted permease